MRVVQMSLVFFVYLQDVVAWADTTDSTLYVSVANVGTMTDCHVELCGSVHWSPLKSTLFTLPTYLLAPV